MSIINHTLRIEDILNRVAEVIGSDKNVDIARAFGVAPNTSSNWKTRQTIPWAELFLFSKKNNVSFEWLLTGKEPPAKESESESPGLREENARLQQWMALFKDKADFYEKKLKDYEEKLKNYEEKLKNAEKAFFDLKRDGDNNGFDPKLVRKIPW